MKITSGEWKAVPFDSASWEVVAKIHGHALERNQANCQAISAVPEMIETLQSLLADAENYDLHIGEKRAKMIRKALSKAGIESKCEHRPCNPDTLQTVCEDCGIELLYNSSTDAWEFGL